MATVGTIAIGITTTMGGFIDGLNSAGRKLSSFASSAAQVGGIVTGALGGLSVAGIVAFTQNQAEAIDVTSKLATKLGVTTESLVAIQHAGDLAGASTEDVAGALEMLARKIGAAEMGDKSAIEDFAKLGLEPAALAAMTATGAFGALGDRLNQINSPTQRAAAGFDVLSKRYSGVAATLAAGSEGFAEAGAEAEKMGKSFSNIQGLQVEAANDSLTKMGMVLQGIGTQLAVQIAPFILEAATQFTNWATSGASVGDRVSSGFEKAAEVIAFVMDVGKNAFDVIAIAVGTLEVALLQMFEVITTGFQKTMETAAMLPERLGGGESGVFAGAARESAAAAAWAAKHQESIAAGVGERMANFGANNAQKNLAGFLEGVRAKAEMAAQSTKKVGESAEQTANRLQGMGEGKKVMEGLQTPMEKFKSETEKLQGLLDAGNITQEFFERGTSKAFEDLAKASGITEIKAPAALMKGSAEAASAIAKAERQAMGQDPQARVEAVLKEQKEIQRQQLDYQKRMADALDTNFILANF